MSTDQQYTALARRFRPQAFEDVVGQQHIADALCNAIRNGRVAHAYLFTGARGVGKTSTARILAKALNCPNASDGVPCNDCEICDGITGGNDVDVLEIDGASNRGIDDIRSLRANVGVRSMRTKFKLYIIDEVHMLTREAFNALLKTLEEPPPNVKFVFCTTEPTKVPDTILSRCQRFDFSSIDSESIADRLRQIATAEGFEVDDEAIELVARRARGSMRDSQSLFDQLLAFSTGRVEANDVHRLMGTASDELLVQLFDGVTLRQPGQVLEVIDQALSSGVRVSELLDQCLHYVRDLMVTGAEAGNVRLLSVGSSHADSLAAQAGRFGLPTLMAAFQILSEASQRIFRSTFSRTIFEAALIQLSVLENLSALSSLLSGEIPLPAELPALESSEGGPAGRQKKTPEDTPTPADAASADTEVAKFGIDNLPQLMAQLIAVSTFTVQSCLKAASSQAILGPNHLDLQFLPAYDSARRQLEQPENSTLLCESLCRITGLDGMRVTFSVVEAEEEPAASESPQIDTTPNQPPAETPPAIETARKKAPTVVSDAPDDELVQQALEIFGGAVVRVEELTSASTESADTA